MTKRRRTGGRVVLTVGTGVTVQGRKGGTVTWGKARAMQKSGLR